MRCLPASLLAISLGTLACAPTQRSKPSPQRQISVHGSATIQLLPDSVEISVGVQTTGTSAGVCLSTNATKVQSILAALRKHGIDSTDVQVSQLTVNGPPRPPGEPSECFANCNVTATLPMSGDPAGVLRAVIEAGGSQSGGLRYFHAGAVEGEEQDGLKRAYANALTKAETLASLSGGVPGKALSASEDANRVYPNFGGPGRAMGRVVMGHEDSGVEERTFSVSLTYELQ
jgi:uncharacterized protein YggE